jgi:hypothetical protein
MSAETFWATYATRGVNTALMFDGTPFHRVDTEKVPPGHMELDVKLDDNGEMFDCVMVAGLIGMRVSSSGDETLSTTGEDDTVSPASGWWMFMKWDDEET